MATPIASLSIVEHVYPNSNNPSFEDCIELKYTDCDLAKFFENFIRHYRWSGDAVPRPPFFPHAISFGDFGDYVPSKDMTLLRIFPGLGAWDDDRWIQTKPGYLPIHKWLLTTFSGVDKMMFGKSLQPEQQVLNRHPSSTMSLLCVDSKIQAMFYAIFRCIKDCHKVNLVSGMLSVDNYRNDKTGIYVKFEDGRTSTIILCPNRVTAGDQEVLNRIKEDLLGLKAITKKILEEFMPIAHIPHQFASLDIVFDSLVQDNDLEILKEGEVYLMRSPVCWRIDDPPKMIDFIYYIASTKKWNHLNVDGSDLTISVADWYVGIDYPGQFASVIDALNNLSSLTPTEKCTYPLFSIFSFGTPQQGWAGMWNDRYKQIDGVGFFLRNAMHHYNNTTSRSRRKAGLAFNHSAIEEFIRVELPDVLTRLYSGFVKYGRHTSDAVWTCKPIVDFTAHFGLD